MARVRAILGMLLVVAGFVVAVCFGLYAVGASDFPDYREPNRYRAKPDLRALYLDVEAGGIEDVPRLNPVSAWGYRLWQLSGWQGAPPRLPAGTAQPRGADPGHATGAPDTRTARASPRLGRCHPCQS